MGAQEKLNELRTLKKSYSDLADRVLPTSALLTELENGKQEMVNALATKNVQSSTDKTLSAIAGDVRSIAQSPITIDGGEMYEKQLFGAPTDKTNAYEQPDTPSWNLYQVMANLLNDGRFVTYGGILLAEYDKITSSIELNKAGAGGAYLTSDGAFYQEDVTHTWNDLSDFKVNRWVAYLFANEARSFEITSTNNPLSIHVGRHLGTISLAVNANLSSLVVTDGNKLDDFNSNAYTTQIKGETVIRVGEIQNRLLYNYNGYNLVLMCDSLPSGKYFINSLSSNCDLYIKAERINGIIMGNNLNSRTANLTIDCPYIYGAYQDGIINNGGGGFTLKNVTIKTEYAQMNYWSDFNTEKFTLLYITNDKTQGVSLTFGTSTSKHTKCEDIELQEGWCKPLSVSTAPNLTEENMINHILKRLKQDEELCGSGVTMTLGSTNLARLTSEEAVALLDRLTNIYGYTFA